MPIGTIEIKRAIVSRNAVDVILLSALDLIRK